MPSAKKKRPAKIADLATDIADAPDDVPAVARSVGIAEDALALQIDTNLGERIWAGTTFEDRLGHFTAAMQQDLAGSIERSLMQQETFDDFQARLFKDLGIETAEPAGALAKFETQVYGEAKLAWNQAMVAANEDADTDLVWRSVLGATTTPGCAARHGKRIDADLGGEVPPIHWRDKCDLLTIPNPDSENTGTAADGQAILDEMQAEREAWGASDADLLEESARVTILQPSRFASFREIEVDDVA